MDETEAIIKICDAQRKNNEKFGKMFLDVTLVLDSLEERVKTLETKLKNVSE